MCAASCTGRWCAVHIVVTFVHLSAQSFEKVLSVAMPKRLVSVQREWQRRLPCVLHQVDNFEWAFGFKPQVDHF